MPSKYPNKTRTLPNSASNPFEEQLHGWLGCNWSFKSMFTVFDLLARIAIEGIIERKSRTCLSQAGTHTIDMPGDVYHPIAKIGDQVSPNGLGWIIVHSLDSLMIMNITSQLSDARDWVNQELSYDQD
ncbi:Glycoside hydrolase family 47 [Penicillium manginii]|uniref:Glycoside hydrolase family 47 n=1 Tax=Penicillium manginii TaxID=203109 RepID=UPI0025468C89|nr:Glycoside hydrolase family 47 [Penicillium manginii]KAJ5754661.1 Glycoside hydrolase family 47 [Penicillium manginii]